MSKKHSHSSMHHDYVYGQMDPVILFLSDKPMVDGVTDCAYILLIIHKVIRSLL